MMSHIWVQEALPGTGAMLRRVGPKTNPEKTKAMVFTPGFIWGKWSEEAYKRQATGEGETFRERNRTTVSCSECSVTVEVLSLKHHMVRHHGVSAPHTRGVDEVGGEPTSFPRVLKKVK